MNFEKIKQFLKIRENQYLVLLMLFVIAIRVYYFIKLGNQPIWWDEGDYLSIAKVWALNLPEPEWFYKFTGIRPLLIPLIWMAMIKIGIGEIGLRFFTLLIPSIVTVYLVYAVARDLYNSKVGLIAGFIMSVYWVHLFYTFRLLTDIPALFFGMLTIYFFYSRYYLRHDKKGLYLACLFGVIAFAARFPHASVLIACFLFLFVIEKKRFFMKKINWKALLLILILLSPYLVYFVYNNFYVVDFYLNPGNQNFQRPYLDVWVKIKSLVPSLFGPGMPLSKNVFLIFFFIGLFSLFGLFLGADIFLRQESKKFNSDFFVLLWIISQVMIYFVIMRAFNDRWLLMLLPAFFILTAKGFYISGKYIKKYSGQLAIFIIIALILFGGYSQLKHTDALIEIKKETYKEVMLAGLWLKENTPPETKVITASIVQNEYYSERMTYDFASKEGDGFASQEEFEQKVNEIQPDYFIINIVQRTPEWAYTYPREKGLTPVQYYLADEKYSAMYGIPEGQPLLVIYKF
jgi:4-amino-4-deoxy-L-arabinose transferase-like glycosyltransferase